MAPPPSRRGRDELPGFQNGSLRRTPRCRPLDACLKEVEESDLFIGIYALRYGFIPEGADISITEMEYLHAKKLGKPIYCFLLDEENQPLAEKMDRG
ncbi:MAG: DUF4062 domain-containing protein [Candidatus Moduliflexus flocculans]|nr:DUF4062 domain-containing protein [Candidatus Moduliflexus flocculans]